MCHSTFSWSCTHIKRFCFCNTVLEANGCWKLSSGAGGREVPTTQSPWIGLGYGVGWELLGGDKSIEWDLSQVSLGPDSNKYTIIFFTLSDKHIILRILKNVYALAFLINNRLKYLLPPQSSFKSQCSHGNNTIQTGLSHILVIWLEAWRTI